MATLLKRVALLISGRGSNMEAIVTEAQGGILAGLCEVVLVFANRRQAEGLERARALGVETACLESHGKSREAFDAELLALLEPYHPDYLVLAGYMRLLSAAVIDRYRNRIINIHPADTREHQGLAGYRWAFEKGKTRTLVTVHLVDEGLDTGRILAQREVDLRGATTLAEVEQRGLAVEHQFYSEVLRELFEGERELRGKREGPCAAF